MISKNLILLYDIQKFNYIRTVMKDIEEVADEEVSGSIDLENENNKSHKEINSPSKKSKRETISSNDSKKTKKSQKKSKKNNKSKSYSSSSSSSSSSDENEKNKKNPLTKEAIMLLKNKDAEAARTFILNLPFYGSDVNLTRKSPNGSDFKVGFGFEPNIKISVASHIARIDKLFENDKKNMNKMKQKMFARKHTSLVNSLFNSNRSEETTEGSDNNKDKNETGKKEEKTDEPQKNKLIANDYMNSSERLKDLFSKKSLVLLKLLSLLYFLILISLFIAEFMITYNKFTHLKNYSYYSNYQFEILSSIMYCKYFLTEAVLAQNESYIIYDSKYSSNHKSYILANLDELRKYREILYNDLSAFSEPDKIDPSFADYTQNKYLLIRMLIASEPSNKLTPFWSAMNQIPTSIFSLVKVENDVKDINMENRNVYDLMMNLINDYFVGWRDITNMVIKLIIKTSELSVDIILIFIFSFIFCVLYIFIYYFILSRFLKEGTRPVDLILTIKKSRFEDMKVICENYMNTLMNKFLGDEVNNANEGNDMEKDINSFEIDENDIMISKFQKENVYNQGVFKNKTYLYIFLGSIITMIIFQIYFIIKFISTSTSYERIRLCMEVSNVTRNAETDVVMSYNVLILFINLFYKFINSFIK